MIKNIRLKNYIRFLLLTLFFIQIFFLIYLLYIGWFINQCGIYYGKIVYIKHYDNSYTAECLHPDLLLKPKTFIFQNLHIRWW